MKIKKEEILGIMKKVYDSIISNASNIGNDTSELIIFNNETITGFNEEIAVNYPFKTGIECAVRLTELYKLLQKVKDDSIALIIENNELILEAKNIDAGFPLIKDYTVPDIGNEVDNWETLPTGFIDGIQFCSFSVSTDISDGILVALEIKDNHIRTTDNYRLTDYYMGSKIKFPFLLHQKFIKSITAHNPIKVSQDESWIHFCDEKDGILSVRKLAESYPEIDEFFNIEKIEDITFSPKLEDILGRVRILALDENNNENAIVTINNDEIICECQGEYGWIVEAIKNETKHKIKKELKFIAGIQHLLQILDKTKTAIIGENRLLFEHENFKHVIVTTPSKE